MKERICTYIFVLGAWLLYVAALIDEDRVAELLTRYLNTLPMDVKINGIWYENTVEE